MRDDAPKKWRIEDFYAEKNKRAFVCSGQEVKALPSSRMKGKGKCLPVTGRSRCSKCYCSRNVDDFCP